MARLALALLALAAAPLGAAGDCAAASDALVRRPPYLFCAVATAEASRQNATLAAGAACADGPGNAVTCSPACTAAQAAYVASCASAPFTTANVFDVYQFGINLSVNNSCRPTFFSAATSFLAAGTGDDCSNAVLYLGGAQNNYMLCGTSGSSACPAACVSILANVSSYCTASSMVVLPADALAVYRISCASETCAVGPASFAVVNEARQLHLPTACALPFAAQAPNSSEAASVFGGAVRRLAIAAAAAAAAML